MSNIKPVTLKDIAGKARVSQSAVSTVLNDRSNGIFVSETTRRTILSAAEELGYVARRRNAPPREPKENPSEQTSSRLIAVMLGRRFGGSLFTDIFYGLNAALSQQGFHPVVLDTSAETYTKSAERESERLAYAEAKKFRAIALWHEGGMVNTSQIRSLSEQMPLVTLDRKILGLDLDYVGSDNFQGGYDATHHLIELGHRKIAHLTRLGGAEAAMERMRGYRQALQDCGIDPDPRFLIPTMDNAPELNADRMRAVFCGPDRPSALFLPSDYWAASVYRCLRDLNLRCPEDVALIGFDNIGQFEAGDLELSSMAQDFEGIGQAVGELLLRRISQPYAPTMQRIFPTRLIARRSTLGSLNLR